MITLYKNKAEYRIRNNLGYNKSLKVVDDLIAKGEVIEIPKGTKYLYLGDFKKFYESE